MLHSLFSTSKVRAQAGKVNPVLVVLGLCVLGSLPFVAHSLSPRHADFVGLNQPKAPQVKTLLPETAKGPVVLEFSSRFCHDCQKLKPVLEGELAKHPKVAIKVVDVIKDKSSEAALLRAFKPVTVPVVVFIEKGGDIHSMLYNAQTAQTLASNLTAIETANGTHKH